MKGIGGWFMQLYLHYSRDATAILLALQDIMPSETEWIKKLHDQLCVTLFHVFEGFPEEKDPLFGEALVNISLYYAVEQDHEFPDMSWKNALNILKKAERVFDG